MDLIPALKGYFEFYSGHAQAKADEPKASKRFPKFVCF
jgi:hypothetical protein